MPVRLIIFIIIIVVLNWNAICRKNEYIIKMHGKASYNVWLAAVCKGFPNSVQLSLQILKLVWKLSSFLNSFQTETASM